MNKKTAVILAAAMALAAAAPASAAVNVSGMLDNQVKYQKDPVTGKYRLNGWAGLKLKTGVTLGGSNQVQAVVQLKPWELEKGLDKDDRIDLDLAPNLGTAWPSTPMSFAIDKAYLLAEGALWHGGPSAKTTLGDVDIAWNSFVGTLTKELVKDGEERRVRGVKVEEMNIGPVSGRAFMSTDQEVGVGLATSMSGATLGGIVIADRQNDKQYVGVDAGATVLPNVDVKGSFALDGERDRAFDVKAETSVLPNTTVTAGYRLADGDFDLRYAKMVDRDADNNPLTGDEDGIEAFVPEAFMPGKSGFYGGLDTTQMGVRLTAHVDQADEAANVKVATNVHGIEIAGQTWVAPYNGKSQVVKNALDVSRTIGLGGFDVTAGYGLAQRVDKNDLEHTLKASTTVNVIPQLQRLKVGAKYVINDEFGGRDRWNISGDYKAPNGLDLGVMYDSIDGASVSAGAKVDF